MGDFKEPTALLEKNRGISLALAACPILDTLLTCIPADEEPLCGNAAVYAIIIICTVYAYLYDKDHMSALPIKNRNESDWKQVKCEFNLCPLYEEDEMMCI